MRPTTILPTWSRELEVSDPPQGPVQNTRLWGNVARLGGIQPPGLYHFGVANVATDGAAGYLRRLLFIYRSDRVPETEEQQYGNPHHKSRLGLIPFRFAYKPLCQTLGN